MPVELHERLSEFSYGYGVTREFERILTAQGLSAMPFLPSLLHEAKLGFDVGFKRRGFPLLLQFKLGQAMQRFIPKPRPTLGKPFWRFSIDTSEQDGQFELLLKAERDGADVFYLAPKFHDWEVYLEAFERVDVIKRSLVLKPDNISKALVKGRVSNGKHKIVYDEKRAYLCSEPLDLTPEDPFEVAALVRHDLEIRSGLLSEVLEQVFVGFADRSSIRRRGALRADEDRSVYDIPSEHGRQQELRQRRFSRLRENGRSHDEAVALLVGAEAWSSGSQLIFVTMPD
jgi:hypothetical protein